MAMPQNSPSQNTKPFSIRLTAEERKDLASRAGSRPVGAYVKSLLFAGDDATRRPPTRAPHKSQIELGKILAYLGDSRLASNFNQITKAVNQGALPVTAELEAELKAACDHISEIRQELLEALGVRRSAQPRSPEATKPFNRASRASR